MIDEVLFAQVRLFRMFCERFGLEPSSGNSLWNEFGIWGFIEGCYDTLHLSGDESALDDIQTKLAFHGVSL